jgi:hypothetical protein
MISPLETEESGSLLIQSIRAAIGVIVIGLTPERPQSARPQSARSSGSSRERSPRPESVQPRLDTTRLYGEVDQVEPAEVMGKIG